jgi:hypothetical protein
MTVENANQEIEPAIKYFIKRSDLTDTIELSQQVQIAH